MNLEGKKVFLSGPMTGCKHYNIAQFATAHAIVAKDFGAIRVFNPAQLWVNEDGKMPSIRRTRTTC